MTCQMTRPLNETPDAFRPSDGCQGRHDCLRQELALRVYAASVWPSISKARVIAGTHTAAAATECSVMSVTALVSLEVLPCCLRGPWL
jgi:hypothetical protein